jgi:predicted nuclease of predicted toxin-antitoxin system
LILDEHYSPAIARALRFSGHDVIAVAERRELRGRTDAEVLEAATGDQRAIVTENVRDFRPLVANALHHGAPVAGLVCVSPREFPRSREGSRRMVEALIAMLGRFPGDHDLLAAGGEVWLRPIP